MSGALIPIHSKYSVRYVISIRDHIHEIVYLGIALRLDDKN